MDSHDAYHAGWRDHANVIDRALPPGESIGSLIVAGDNLRARVAKLEAALRDIADHSEPMSAAIARAALEGE